MAGTQSSFGNNIVIGEFFSNTLNKIFLLNNGAKVTAQYTHIEKEQTPSFRLMKIEEAILYCLASQNRGMRTEQIAEMINRKQLHTRKDGQPVTSNQVYAVICRFPNMFTKAEGRIMLMI